jgi:drug/metabolite transporter (DMT)-like permease
LRCDYLSDNNIKRKNPQTNEMQISQDLIIGVSAGLLTASLYAASVVVYRREGKEIGPVGAASIKMWIAFLLMSLIIILPLGYNPFALSLDIILLLSL